jgi:hypothetical protein
MKKSTHFPVTKAPHRLLAAVLLLTPFVPTLRADFPVELLQQRRIQTDVGVSELEGLHLAIDGTTLVQSDFLSSFSVVRAFVLQGTNWVPQAIFQPENPEGEFGFGESIAIDGDTVVVGSPFEASAPPFQGRRRVQVPQVSAGHRRPVHGPPAGAVEMNRRTVAAKPAEECRAARTSRDDMDRSLPRLLTEPAHQLREEVEVTGLLATERRAVDPHLRRPRRGRRLS